MSKPPIIIANLSPPVVPNLTTAPRIWTNPLYRDGTRPNLNLGEKVFLNWDGASGTTWPEWTYNAGQYMYELTGTDPNVGETTSTTKITSTRSGDKRDYGADTQLTFDTSVIAPIKVTGASAKFVSNDVEGDRRPTWWVWYDSFGLWERDLANETTDRMAFWVRLGGANVACTGTSTLINMHVGTYVCRRTGGNDGCPHEGPGNNHYYHYLGINPGAWVKVELDNQPQHLRSTGVPPVNPPVALYPNVGWKGYYADMQQFYVEVRHAQASQTTMWLDKFTLFSTTESAETNQNQQSISSPWVGFWELENEWQIGFFDCWTTSAENGFSSYEIRYSLSPITNANWSSATPVTPLEYASAAYISHTSPYAFRSPTEYNHPIWQRFVLPPELQTDGQKIYFAIKDVSVAGQHGGTNWPYSRTDQKNPPNDHIRCIDYTIKLEG